MKLIGKCRQIPGRVLNSDTDVYLNAMAELEPARIRKRRQKRLQMLESGTTKNLLEELSIWTSICEGKWTVNILD